MQRPHERVSLSDERPARAEAEEPETLITRASTEEVADKCVTPVVRQANDGNGGKEGKRILRDPNKRTGISKDEEGNVNLDGPFPQEDAGEHEPEEASKGWR